MFLKVYLCKFNSLTVSISPIYQINRRKEWDRLRQDLTLHVSSFIAYSNSWESISNLTFWNKILPGYPLN